MTNAAPATTAGKIDLFAVRLIFACLKLLIQRLKSAAKRLMAS